MSGRLAKADPYQGWLRRRLRIFFVVCALVAALSTLMGWGLVFAQKELVEGVYGARNVTVPPELAWAVERAAAGDWEPFRQEIPKHPEAALALLIDREHAPASMDFRNPLRGMSEADYSRLIRECAGAFPLLELTDEFEEIGRAWVRRGSFRASRTQHVDRALLLLSSHPDRETAKLVAHRSMLWGAKAILEEFEK